METDSPRLPPTPTWIVQPRAAATPDPTPPAADSTPPVAESAPTPGIAAKVARDSDLASHPSVLVYHSFASKQYIRDSFVGIAEEGRPSLDRDCELIDVPEFGVKGLRLWASYTQGGVNGNERIVSWWGVAEPKLAGARFRPFQRDYGQGYDHLFVRYLLKVGDDVATNAGIPGGKIPGMTGTYNIQAQGIAPPSPQFNPFALWEARMFHGYPVGHPERPNDGITPQTQPGKVGQHPLGVYYYGVRAPRFFRRGKDLTTTWSRDAVIDTAPGLPASPGKYDGMGTPGGTPMTSGFLRPGVWHCIEQQVKLNSVKDVALKAPKSALLEEQMQEMIDNANEDGELRAWLDGVLVYENVKVAFRGLDTVRIQSIPFVNIYQGGRGTYPKGPEHYDLCAMVAATEYVGPPVPRAETRAAAPATKQSLGSLAATMEPGTWAELIAGDIDAVIGVGRAGNAENALPYANSVPWCPIRKRIVFVGGDHGDAPARHIEYDDATNRWLLIERGLGSHNYQHVAVDPHSGDVYQRFAGDLYRYSGQTWVSVATIPFNVSQVASVALAWWSGPYPNAGGHGVLTIYNGNTGTISAFDPVRGGWLADMTDVLPGQRGQYHVVSAYSAKHNCLVYGGGNSSQGVNPVERQTWRLNADLSQTRMPDAPHPVGVYHGMNLVSDSASGDILALGFGEAWELDPSGAGTWARMSGRRSPPQGLLSPNVSPNCVISCDVGSYGVVVYVDALRSRKPRCRMWVYKSR